ncbi:helix-turn-helix domain-containing protein [Noviherbaspirillum sp. CPCC 100848]|uniref:Helix-turn-helix domain-containing protein n=1 Tax=Noviherbaspirillum album TaxID=3080276 RepID=A0ABU6JAV1_9BURK|nr:helix-turn-helix domain-containing protein [Noviherbaspirillum sp. CPCC 100848]MEC4720387.1 helix-turn-helix domain-containing protein [Noviherbaspirillum sp. CPCC 100848]
MHNQVTPGMQKSINLSNPLSISEALCEMMVRHGVGPRQQTGKVAEILGLSLSQARRIMERENSEWIIGQLDQVFAFFSETFTLSVSAFDAASTPENSVPESTEAEDNEKLPATLQIESREFDCLFTPGPAHMPLAQADFAAMLDDGRWILVECSAAPSDARLRPVKGIELLIKEQKKHSVAVLEDDRGAADSMVDVLNAMGFDSEAFYDVEELEAALAQKQFDAFVVDWLLGQRTSESVIRSVRANRGKAVPILLLTGQLETGMADEAELASVVSNYAVIPHEKPFRPMLVAAALNQSLALSSVAS